MEQGIAKTCQSLNFELCTSLWLALSMRMAKPQLDQVGGVTQVLSYWVDLLNHRDGNR